MTRTRWLPLLMLGLCSGCSGPDGDLPEAYRRVDVPTERLEDPAARLRGRELFLAHCALCHGDKADGHGVRRASFVTPPADFTSRSWRERSSPRRVFWIVREGVRGSPMPGWKGTLSAARTWDLVAYLRSVAEGVE